MLHIILVILKIIGLIFLALFCLLLAMVLLILFCPVRYAIQVKKQEKIFYDIRISWLLHALSLRMENLQGEREAGIKILGIPWKSGQKTSKRKKIKKKKVKRKKEENDVWTDSVQEPVRTMTIETKPNNENEKNTIEVKKERKKKKFTFKGFYGKIKKTMQSVRDFKDFLQDTHTKGAVLIIKEQLFYLLKKLKPDVFKLTLMFGTGDPASTGQILGGFGILYAVTGWDMEITPYFEEKICTGSIWIKGYICMVHVIKVLWKLYRNEDVRYVYNKSRE